MVKKNLKWFLIRRFLLIMLFVYLCEEALGSLYRVFMEPLLQNMLEGQNIRIVNNGSIWDFLLQALFYFAATMLPKGVSDVLQYNISAAMGESLRISVDSPVFAGRYGQIYAVVLLFLFLGLFLFGLLPYFIGAYAYYRSVNKKVKELLEEEKEQQRAYDRERNLLLSNIAHDIKTPITTICGYSRALADGEVREEKEKEYLNAIYAKSMRMSDLITLLFEYVKLDSAGFELHKKKEDIAELLRESVAALYVDFEEKTMEVEMDVPEEKVPYEMDRIQMACAISNLLTNAIRYGKENGKVLVRLRDDAITVADDGDTIDPEFAKHIFEPFSRADKARSTKGGSGLGLSIASKIVMMHGGRLRLDCGFGDGYTKAFVIELK